MLIIRFICFFLIWEGSQSTFSVDGKCSKLQIFTKNSLDSGIMAIFAISTHFKYFWLFPTFFNQFTRLSVINWYFFLVIIDYLNIFWAILSYVGIFFLWINHFDRAVISIFFNLTQEYRNGRIFHATDSNKLLNAFFDHFSWWEYRSAATIYCLNR